MSKVDRISGRQREPSGMWKMDNPLRIDSVASPEDLQKLSFLSDEEKALGASLMMQAMSPKYEMGIGKGELPDQERLFGTHVLGSLLRDPELYDTAVQHYERLVKMVTGLDGNDEIMQASSHRGGMDVTAKADDLDVRRRYRNGMLMVFAVASEHNATHMLRTLAVSSTQIEPDANGSYCIPAEKIAMIRYPESSVWSEEESLVLEFSYAVMRHQMTDDLWARVMNAWGHNGEKEPLRYIQWIGHYIWQLMTQDVVSRRTVW